MKLTQEQQNAKFEALSPTQKRIRIAKDVLAQLDAAEEMKKFTIETGSYCLRQ